jgi:hypothetical protein
LAISTWNSPIRLFSGRGFAVFAHVARAFP